VDFDHVFPSWFWLLFGAASVASVFAADFRSYLI
jgi:hypothetical protein